MDAYRKVMRGVVTVENAVMVLTTLAILILIFVNVIGRFVFNHSFAFADELVVAVFVLVSLIGAALSSRVDGGLVGLSLFSDQLKGKSRLVQKLVANGISVLYCAVLTYEGFVRTAIDYTRNQHTFVLHWPMWMFRIFVPLAGICLILHLIENTLNFVEEHK